MRLRRTASLVRIECDLSDKTITELMKDLEVGAYQGFYAEWRERKEFITKNAEKVRAETLAEYNKNPAGKPGTLDKEVMVYLSTKVLEKYP